MDKVPALSDRLRLTKEYRDEMVRFVKVRDLLPTNKSELSNYEIYSIFKPLSQESLYVTSLMFDDWVKSSILLYINELSLIKTEISGRDVTELGIEPGPEVKKFLEIVLKEKINGKIYTRNDEIEFIKRNLSDEEKK